MIAILLALASAVGAPPPAPAEPIDTDICRIHQDRDRHLGTTVRLQAVLKSDMSHFAFLQDPGCGSDNNQLDLGKAWGNPDYDALREEWKAQCAARGSPGLCVIEQPVRVVGSLRMSTDGHLSDTPHPVIDLVSIEESVAEDARPVPVPLVRLIAAPGDYDGVRVSTMGVLDVGELASLCLDAGSARHGAFYNCMVVGQDDGFLTGANARDYHGRYVRVVGRFDTSRPRPRLYEGVIRDVEAVDELPF